MGWSEPDRTSEYDTQIIEWHYVANSKIEGSMQFTSYFRVFLL
jgi:hypothetical protein